MTRVIRDSVSDRRHPTVASTDPVVVGLGRVLLVVLALVLGALLAVGFGYLDLCGQVRTTNHPSLERIDQSLAE